MCHEEEILPSAATLRIDFTVRHCARSCYVIRLEKKSDLASTSPRFIADSKISTLESVFKKFRIRQRNSPDTCRRKATKSYGLENIRILELNDENGSYDYFIKLLCLAG